MTHSIIIYHSGSGHTKLQAEAVLLGVQSANAGAVTLLTVEEAAARLDEPDATDAIIFGCPTYMGSMSASMKLFIETAAEITAQFVRGRLA
jgi:NAD(P)H dehydrogenase (quinone)